MTTSAPASTDAGPAQATELELAGRIVDWARTPRRRRATARAAVLDGLSPPPRVPAVGATQEAPLRHDRQKLGRRVAVVVVTHAAVYACFLATWAVAGRAALDGRFGLDDVAGFGLAAAGLVTTRWMAVAAASAAGVEAGRWLKERTLQGGLALDADSVSRRGVGPLLGVTLEADALESLALAGGQLGLLAAAELAASVVVVAAEGTSRGPLLVALAAWMAVTAALAARYARRRRAWTAQRLMLTAELVEQLGGHRTRLAQGHADDHRCDLDSYLRLSERLDRAAVALVAIVPRGWLLAGLAVLAPRLAEGPSASAVVAAGGVLLAWHGLEKLVLALTQLIDASATWAPVAPLVHASRRPPELRVAASEVDRREALVVASGVDFAHPGRPPLLVDASVAISAGERVLLTGPSGAGKSTLASLLVGLRQPDAGVVERGGTIVLVPQHHENHVLSASLAFNLLLGRSWPPEPDDLWAATEVCRELGLDGVLAQMPGGLSQPVGECGWQLSQGEQARLFIARALLQRPEGLVVDESLAALDPESLAQVVQAVVARVATVVVVAHR